MGNVSLKPATKPLHLIDVKRCETQADVCDAANAIEPYEDCEVWCQPITAPPCGPPVPSPWLFSLGGETVKWETVVKAGFELGYDLEATIGTQYQGLHEGKWIALLRTTGGITPDAMQCKRTPSIVKSLAGMRR